MEKTRFAIIGSGWRAEFFIRIAQALPEEFDLSGVLVRHEAKAKYMDETYQIPSFRSLDELEASEVDFVVLAVNRDTAPVVLDDLMRRGIPVLCETPPAADIEALKKLWASVQEQSGKIQVAEQYFLQPIYSAWYQIIQQGILGNIETMRISAIHDYHAMSIIRHFLDLAYEGCEIIAEEFTFDAVETMARSGVINNGERKSFNRLVAQLKFSSGQRVFYDFTSLQYHSLIRERHVSLQGDRGELDDLTCRYLNANNQAVKQSIERIDFGPYGNDGPSHFQMQMGGEVLYESPFAMVRFNDDEIAIASLLRGMANYVKTAEEIYPLAEAMQDTYLAFLMHEAAQTKQVLKTEKMPWQI